ncbi:MAG: methylenetetrahydrofolate reductase [Actinomycetaceae bacterium]|nr:methylenetetrahydrofolate reductase [Actinomycetaceae bacterium]
MSDNHHIDGEDVRLYSERRFSAGRFSDDLFDMPDDAIIEETSLPLSMCIDETCVPSEEHPTLSFEFYPARGLDRLRANVASVRRMLHMGTDFVTVTYGAAGSRQDGTKELVSWLVQAGVPTFVHLTCQADSLYELDETIDDLLSLGVQGILALRGDEQDGMNLVLPHATDLISRIRGRSEHADYNVRIITAAFPTGHPESSSLVEDALTLVKKQEAGADFAITQHFFHAHEYGEFIELFKSHGGNLPVIPGLTPLTSLGRLKRMCQLANYDVPQDLLQRLTEAPDAHARRDIAVETCVKLVHDVKRLAVPGVQLFTMNDEPTAARIFHEIAPLFGKEIYKKKGKIHG